jgi:hypothetical protein
LRCSVQPRRQAARRQLAAALGVHRIPDGVGTNVFFAEVPEIDMILPDLFFIQAVLICRKLMMAIYGTSAKKTFVLTPFGSRQGVKPGALRVGGALHSPGGVENCYVCYITRACLRCYVVTLSHYYNALHCISWYSIMGKGQGQGREKEIKGKWVVIKRGADNA